MYDFDTLPEELQEQIIEQARKQYSNTLIDHWLHPRCLGRLENPDGHAKQYGTCGDTMEIFIRARDNKITEASFWTDGCITTIASGSMAVEMAKGKSIEKASTISQVDILDGLGGLPKESQHCALLAANTLKVAIDEYRSIKKKYLNSK